MYFSEVEPNKEQGWNGQDVGCQLRRSWQGTPRRAWLLTNTSKKNLQFFCLHKLNTNTQMSISSMGKPVVDTRQKVTRQLLSCTSAHMYFINMRNSIQIHTEPIM